MKRPPQNSRSSREMLTLSSREGKPKSKLKNQQWLKKHGISSQAFSNAKSEGSYNPHLIKKQRDLYRNAKLIKKFKKFVKLQNPESSMLQASRPEIDDTGIELDGDDQQNQIPPADEERRGLLGDVQDEQIQPADQERRKGKKKTLQFVREEYEKRRAEEEKAKMEREAIAKARQEERERAIEKRKDLRGKMFKKTRSGQPVMKFRIQHILEGIAGNPDI